jgi:hypothetical protein
MGGFEPNVCETSPYQPIHRGFGIEPLEKCVHFRAYGGAGDSFVVDDLVLVRAAHDLHGICACAVITDHDSANARPTRKERGLPSTQTRARQRIVPVVGSVLHDIEKTLDVSRNSSARAGYS